MSLPPGVWPLCRWATAACTARRAASRSCDQDADAGGLAHTRTAADDRDLAHKCAGDRCALIGLEHEAVVLLGTLDRPLELCGLEQGCLVGQKLFQAIRGFALRLVQLAAVDVGIVRVHVRRTARPRSQRPRWRQSSAGTRAAPPPGSGPAPSARCVARRSSSCRAVRSTSSRAAGRRVLRCARPARARISAPRAGGTSRSAQCPASPAGCRRSESQCRGSRRPGDTGFRAPVWRRHRRRPRARAARRPCPGRYVAARSRRWRWWPPRRTTSWIDRARVRRDALDDAQLLGVSRRTSNTRSPKRSTASAARTGPRWVVYATRKATMPRRSR